MRPPDDALLTGWGLTAPTRATLHHPESADDVATVLRDAPARGVIARGLGRAYGDAAQNAGGAVIDMTGVARVRELDLVDGVVTADAGVSLDALLRVLVPLGWFVPVTPGTRYVTAGGALAADIHGKNHHHDGAFSNHVTRFTLRLADGDERVIEPGTDAFAATAGGMGLTGVITSVTFRVLPIETALMSVDTDRIADFDTLLAAMEDGDHRYRYSVAWVDLLARGASFGRAVLQRGDHAGRAQVDDDDPLAYGPSTRLAAPPWVPSGLVNKLTVAAFNEVWFRKAPRHAAARLESIPAFFHPLDGVAAWNRGYGRAGFVQYQFVVPFGEEAALRTITERLVAARCPSIVTVLKRFGAGNPLLSFPIPGWTLAVDIPTGLDGLAPLLDGLDDLVVGAGGRVYLAKDSRMRPELVPLMYPELDRWREIRDKLDPTGSLRSDLARRLDLIG